MAAKKKKRQSHIKGILILMLLFIAAVTATLATPVVNIKRIAVTGNDKLDAEEIKKISEIPLGINMFRIRLRESEKKIKKLPYVDSVDINRRLPDTIRIEVSECRAASAVSVAGGFIVIDKNGKALEAATTADDICRINGIKLTAYNLGEIIKAEDESRLDKAKSLMEKLEEYELSEIVREINVSSLNDVTFITKSNLKVILGLANDLDYKIKYFKTLLEKIGEDSGGVLNLTDTEKASFRHSE